MKERKKEKERNENKRKDIQERIFKEKNEFKTEAEREFEKRVH